MNKPFRTLGHTQLAIACALILQGCFSHTAPQLTPKQQSEKIHQFVDDGGYSAKHAYAFNELHETWQHGDQALGISMLAPKTPGAYPLIVYLPGLGEREDSGKLWRETWVQAGYTVFSMQPKAIGEALNELQPARNSKKEEDQPEKNDADEDEDKEEKDEHGHKKTKLSTLAKNSELRYFGHEFFAQKELKKRIEQVFWAYAQLKQRQAAKAPLFAEADLSRVVLAGYDLGAQTTAAIIGEKYDSAMPTDPEFKPVAAILLSPSVDMAQGDLSSRYQNMTVPTLTITGDDDDDPYAISTSYARTALWEFAPPGEKYLLVLQNGSHSLLSGSRFSLRQEKIAPSGEIDENTPDENPRSHFSNAYGGGGRSGGGRGRNGGGKGVSVKRANKQGSRSNTQSFKQVAAVYSVSTAFLDHICKSDHYAKLWMSDQATQWLNHLATLKVK